MFGAEALENQNIFRYNIRLSGGGETVYTRAQGARALKAWRFDSSSPHNIRMRNSAARVLRLHRRSRRFKSCRIHICYDIFDDISAFNSHMRMPHVILKTAIMLLEPR